METQETKESHTPNKYSKAYDKYYKIILIIPLLLLISSIGYLAYFHSQHGDFIKRDVTLTGGTSITIFVEKQINLDDLNQKLSGQISDFSVKELSDFRTGKQQAIVIDTSIGSTDSPDYIKLKSFLETYLGHSLTPENSSVESTGASLGNSFYNQLRFAIIISFVLMALVVFVIYRSVAPSSIVVLCAFADIIMTLTLVDLMGIRVSSAGIIAFLMLIGYSVDTDILLTTRLLRRHGEINHNIFEAFKTGMTMTLTAIVSVVIALLITRSFSAVLEQIFLILTIGLCFDIFNTWISNASILKWYVERKK